MMEFIGVITTCLAVLGCKLNNDKLVACFYVWMVSNLLSLGLHWHCGLWSLMCRDAIFIALGIEGIIKWRGKNG